MIAIRLKTRYIEFLSIISVILLLLLQACSESRIGQELVNSFASPSETIEDKNTLEKLSIKSESKKIPAAKPIVKRKINNTIPITQKKTSQNNLNEIIIPFTPQPYRITIKLSGANPSAPAESVTRALRKAGVKFEVERIELVGPSSSQRPSISGERR